MVLSVNSAPRVTRLKSNSGVALATSIYALVILGTLMSVAFFIGLQDQRAGRNTLKSRNSMGAAESGAEQTITEWNGAINQMAIGDTTLFDGWLADSSGWYRGSVRRVGTGLFFVRSEGFSADSTSRSEVGLLARLRYPRIEIRSALETQGTTEIGGNGHISGIDTIPPGLANCPPLKDAAGLIIKDVTDITYQGGQHQERGDPPILEDPTITDSSLTHFGDQTFAELAALATITMPLSGSAYKIQPSVSGGECRISDIKNWGEPLMSVPECEDYYPVVYSPGDLKINMDRGQGLLIVNGDLYVNGQFRFYGVVLVRGKLMTEGTGGHFFGGVIAGNLNGEGNRVSGDGQVYYSSCAITTSLAGAAPGEPLRERSWMQIF